MRRETAILLAFLLLGPIPAWAAGSTEGTGGVLISAVHPGGSSDWEHVLLSNPGSEPVDVSGWTLADGEGTWSIPWNTTLPRGGSAWTCTNSSAFRVLWGHDPDILAIRCGSFGLADKGDDLVLIDSEGRTVDQLWYGAGSGQAPPGWTGAAVPTTSTLSWGRLLHRTGTSDTGTADDWTGWTEPRCGWLEEVPSAWSGEAEVATFTTPEGGWDALSWAISSAEEDLLVALYDLTSRDLAALVAKRAMAGVRVRMLLEGQPVGTSADDLEYRAGLLAAIVEAGGEVMTTASTVKGERHRPYRFHHEKCCVIDDRIVVVTTENWGAGSFPVPGGGGAFASRGWGAVVRSSGMASSLSRIIEHDIRACGTVPWTGEGVDDAVLPSIPAPPIRGPSFTRGDASLLVGPEAWGAELKALTELIDGARSSIDLELACLDVLWGDEVSPLVEGLLGAAARGVGVRLLLDGGYDHEGEVILRELQVLAARRGVENLTAMVADGIPGVSRLHAKGAIIDGHRVVLGSLNWAWSSVARNRELLVVIDSETAAGAISETFRSDWSHSARRSPGGIPLSLVAHLLRGHGPSPGPVPFGGPVEASADGGDGTALGEDPTWRAIGRAAVVVLAGAVLWTVEARYGVKARVSAWLDGKWRGVRRRWARFIRRRAGRVDPDAPRTAGPGRAREPGSPPDPPPPPWSEAPVEGPSPPDPAPLEPEAASW